MPVVARPDLALDAGADAGDVVGVEREALAFDLDLAAAAQRQVDLLLAVLAVVVLGVAVEVGRQVDHLHAERLDPELGPGALEGAAVDGLHVVDLLHRVSAHRFSSWLVRRFRARRILANERTFVLFCTPGARA